MRIKELHIENFKRFESLHLELGPLNCLVGVNNSGKTTLLQALALFDFCKQHCLAKSNGHWELKDRSIDPGEFYVLPVASPSDLWTDKKTITQSKQTPILIKIIFQNQLEVSLRIRLSFNRFGVGMEMNKNDADSYEQLRNFSVAYLPIFSQFLPQEERRLQLVLDDEISRGRVNFIIRNLLLNLDKSKKEQLQRILETAFPELSHIKIEFEEINDKYIKVIYREKNRSKSFDLFSAGSGFQQFLYLFGFILLKAPKIILLDEPDVHLHGSLQEVLFREMNQLVSGGEQLLFATHSRDLIRHAEPNQIVYLDRGEAKRLEVAFDLYETLELLGSTDINDFPVLQRYKRLLILEDKFDKDILFIFLQKCLGNDWITIQRRLAVCFSRGNPSIKGISGIRDQFQQALKIEGESLQVFAIGDWDYHPERDSLVQELGKRPNEFWHIWERAEIENYLLDINVIYRQLPGSDGELPLYPQSHPLASPLRQYFQDVMLGSKTSVRGRLLNARNPIEKYRRLDPSTNLRQVEEYLDHHWPKDMEVLADAKETVLPGIQRWFQEHKLPSFSLKNLAEKFQKEDLPEEIHDLAKRIKVFVMGTSSPKGKITKSI